MAHENHRDSTDLDAAHAQAIADTMQALATPSRVRILGRLRGGSMTVSQIAEAVDMEQAAVSQQLRVLRLLGFVTGRRAGRHVYYDLHDDHVAHLLQEAIGHVEHVQLGLPDRDHSTAPATAPA